MYDHHYTNTTTNTINEEGLLYSLSIAIDDITKSLCPKEQKKDHGMCRTQLQRHTGNYQFSISNPIPNRETVMFEINFQT